MPRKKKPDQSPARIPGWTPEGGSFDHNTGRGPGEIDSAMAENFPSSTLLSGSEKEGILKGMQEMFAHLDPDVIYLMLSECDFKVEIATDSLLELSVAAEGADSGSSPISGFERPVSALLSPQLLSDSRSDPDFSDHPLPACSLSTDPLRGELDLLVDQELEALTTQQEQSGSQPSSSLPPPFKENQVLPELLQSSLQRAQTSGVSSLLDPLGTWEDKSAKEPKSLVHFTQSVAEAPTDSPKPQLDLGASGRPSAFQVYKRQQSLHAAPPSATVADSNAAVGGARAKVSLLAQEPCGSLKSPWNIDAPEFTPHVGQNQNPAFITPVAQLPSNLTSQPWQSIPRLNHSPISQVSLRLSATMPKSWAPSAHHNRLRLQGRVLVLLRGAPGSGKSTLAKALMEHNPGGVMLSTDDYFTSTGYYKFDPGALGEAHEWNHKRAREAFERGSNPIIIDNTNLQGWEMRPYVVQAVKHGYKVLFREPDTWWRYKPRELVRRTKHDVPLETIRHMLNKHERVVSIQSILGPQVKFEQSQLLENKCSKLLSSETRCPDLVGQPELSHPHLFSSLPDVSLIGHNSEAEKAGACQPVESEGLCFQPTRTAAEYPGIPQVDKDIDSDEVTGIDSQVELNHQTVGQTIPDCIVESVMNEDHQDDEAPVTFSETIAQRVRRERPSRRSCFDSLEPSGLAKDANQSDRKMGDRERTEEEETQSSELLRREGEQRTPKMDFEGDWPSEGFLEQRPVRRRERRKERNREMDQVASQKSDETQNGLQPEVNRTELQKLLDLIQTGVADIQMDNFTLSSLSSSSEDEEPELNKKQANRCHSSSTNSKVREQDMAVNHNHGELPDFVLDQKMSDSGNTKVALMDEGGVLRSENEINIITEASNEMGSLSLIPDNTSSLLAHNNPIAPSETIKANARCDGDVELVSNPADVDSSKCSHTNLGADGSQNNEPRSSPVCEGSVGAEGSSCPGGSQERKQRQGRRSGKQCKLALTFTQNCSSSADPLAGSVNANSCQKTSEAHVETVASEWNTSLEPNSDLSVKPSCIAQPHISSPPVPVGVGGWSSQTELQDFAFLWRLSNQKTPNEEFISAYSQLHNVAVLSGNACRFEVATAGSPAGHVRDHGEVPYRVVHDKGTQVEDKEFRDIQDRLESLRILSRHFKLVSFDTLEDLYDKCHQDLEWTTNLLLDSGEIFFKEEDVYPTSKHCTEDERNGLKCVEFGDQPVQSATEVVVESDQSSSNTSGPHLESTVMDEGHSETPLLLETSQTEHRATSAGERHVEPEQELGSEVDQEICAWGGKKDDGLLIEETIIENEEELASMEAVSALLQAELNRIEEEEKQKEKEMPGRRYTGAGRSRHLDIQTVELKLPTEVALQLIELFGPVGVDPDSTDDCAVQMDLNLAKLIHQKWKDGIQEKQRQATLSFLSLGNVSTNWGESDKSKAGPLLPDGHPEGYSQMPFMDHWNVFHPHISLRDIIKEEQALHDSMEKKRKSLADLDRRDGASLLKETQLYSLFPSIDRHFLQDIFRDHNYSLTHTELFLRSLLDEEPVKTVVAPQAPRTDHYRANSKEREMKQKPAASTKPEYQDTVDPEYEDFRAEASLQRKRQLESFAKAAEAFKQGRKEVASFYAQQGHVHGKLMREANHRAAVHIFERVNSSLLPRNILDLHGLHVDEALDHLVQVLQEKTTAYEKGLCRPQLSVITGRGNHSQGGVARIRPAVINYLTTAHYRFSEPKPGLVLVSLK